MHKALHWYIFYAFTIIQEENSFLLLMTEWKSYVINFFIMLLHYIL